MESEAGPSSHALFASRLCSVRDQPTSAVLDAQEGLALLFCRVCLEKAELAQVGADGGEEGSARLLRAGGSGSAAKVAQSQRPDVGSNNFGVSGATDRAADGEEDEEDVEAWLLEARTWELIHSLFSERLLTSRRRKLRKEARLLDVEQPAPQDEAALPAFSASPYSTPLVTVQEAFEADQGLTELKVVRDWLSAQLAPTHVVEVRKGYWPFTRNQVKASKRLGSSSSTISPRKFAGRAATGNDQAAPLGAFGVGLGASSSDSTRAGRIVRTLDPDAANRDRGMLEFEDAAYDKALNRSLFQYVRAAQLESAIDLAIQVDQSWRAASLRGAMLHWRPGLDDSLEELSEPLGNRNRSLWKAVCLQLAASSKLDSHERALYGALCGDLTSVLAVSSDWESHLWARVNSALERLLEKELDSSATWWSQEAPRSFPEAVLGAVAGGAAESEGAAAVGAETGAVVLEQLQIEAQGPKSWQHESSDVRGILRDIFSTLAQTEAHGINVQANNPYRTVQRAVVLDEVIELLAHVEGRLSEMRGTVDPRQYARLVRFFAHLVLFLRLLGRDRAPPELVCNSILRAYVEVLEFSGQHELVALYASALEPESATQSYAHYLKLLGATGTEARRQALLRAKEHDLDVAAVARTTVAMIFDETFPSIVALASGLTELDAELEPVEEHMIHSLEWLTFDESTHGDALVQANALMRLFLAAGRPHAARILLDSLPPALMVNLTRMAQPPVADETTEHLHLRSFFEALAAHMRFNAVWSRRAEFDAVEVSSSLSKKPQQAPRSLAQQALGRRERESWIVALTDAIASADASIREVLEMGWLKLNVTGQDLGSERRAHELAHIRQLYIPELVLRMHFMLYDTRDYLIGNLAAVLELPNLVADERHKLYLEFVTRRSNRLGEYLNFVREAALAALDRTRTADAFAPLTDTITDVMPLDRSDEGASELGSAISAR